VRAQEKRQRVVEEVRRLDHKSAIVSGRQLNVLRQDLQKSLNADSGFMVVSLQGELRG
jgi:hypothetical protein